MKKQEDIEILEEREQLFSEMIANGALRFEDSRRSSGGNFRYSLQEVLLVWLCAMICGFKEYRDIEWYAGVKIDFFRRFFPYKYGRPSRSTISRVIAIINPEAMNNLLLATISNIRSERLSECIEAQPIALDGKTVCGLQATKENRTKLHIVSAFDTAGGITLAQAVVPEKSNEIIAIKSLLPSLAIEGRILTIDAIGTQKDVTQIIRSGGGHYILAVKKNQSGLYHAIEAYFANKDNLAKLKPYETFDKGHGRIERRVCYATDKATIWFEGEGWVDLKSVVMVKSTRTIDENSSSCIRYFITDLAANPEHLLHAIRAHWDIESMHWTLDVTFNEDTRILWNKTISYNEAIARRLVMNILRTFRETFRLRSKTEKVSYALLQKIMFAEDNKLESLLRGTFK
ncbi:MAG TPA: ISAs1 family transposase [Candidatus Babeliaceae bacterium]|nr:ISAs1 family transposase [Candidatus Babeliaceae bacterium]